MYQSNAIVKNHIEKSFLSRRVDFKRWHQKSDKTLYKIWKIRLLHIKCESVGLSPKGSSTFTKKNRYKPKTVDCVYIVHAESSAVYRFLVHKSENAEIKVNTII